jgi:hypothetical protein
MFRTAVITTLGALAVGVVFSQPAFAADGVDQVEAAPAATLSAPSIAAPRVQRPLTLTLKPAEPARRPAALPALYAGLVATQAFDAYSTERGLANGAREVNPLMQGAGLWTMKAVGTVVPIVIAERMWKKNKVGAVVTMVLANGVMAAVAANNAHVLRQQR